VLVRLHWNLLKLEEHSELFISGLKCILHEHRIPSRLQVAIDELQNDALGLAEMLTEDTWENGRYPLVPGFWGIICLFHESMFADLNAIIGFKCRRLRAWTSLLERIRIESGDPEETKKATH